MSLVETSTFCHQHAWVGKVGQKCPKCTSKKAREEAAEQRRWAALSTEAKLAELYLRIKRLEREPYPDQRIY